MVEAITFQTFFQFLQTVSIMVGIGSYILNIQNNQKNQEVSLKNQELAKETRQLHYFLELNKHILQTLSETYPEILTLQWKDFEDFREKYGMANNPENAKKRNDIWRNHHIAGLMIRDGLLEVQTYIDYIGDAPIQMWNKYKDVIVEYRRVFEFPTYLYGMEYLADVLEKYRVEKGWDPKGPILYVNPTEI